MNWRRLRLLVSQGLLSAIFASCDDGGIFVPGIDRGTLRLAVTDAPADFAMNVVVEFDAVEVKPVDDDPIRIDLEPDVALNLIELTDGRTAFVLSDRRLPEGRYEWIRLVINAQAETLGQSFVDFVTGERFPLEISEEDEAALQLDRSFEIRRRERVEFIVDFDLRRSLIRPSGQSTSFVFRPALRLVDGELAGRITGTVNPGLVTGRDCSPFIYVFEGADVTPDDMDWSAEPGDVEPLLSVPARSTGVGNPLTYRVDFLEEGDYTLALTCDGALDEPDRNDVLRFQRTRSVSIEAGEVATVNF